jgi:hypothetical protein
VIVVIVSGSRDLEEVVLVHRQLRAYNPDLVIHGACPTGADKFADDWCRWHEVACLAVPARFRKLGKPGGPIRNRELVAWGELFTSRGDRVACLTYPRTGTGTKGFIKLAKAAGLEVRES